MIAGTGDRPLDEPVGKDEKKICPFLGLKEDPSTVIGFPAITNYCNLAEPPYPPDMSYQETFCLTEEYKTCPFLLSERNGPLPEGIRAPRIKPPWGARQWNMVLLAAAVLILAVVAWQVVAQDLITKYFTNSSPTSVTTSVSVVITRTRTPTPTDTATLTPTHTNTVSPTRTPSVSPDHVKTATAACAVFHGAFPGTPCP
jgi:hypothetical protein